LRSWDEKSDLGKRYQKRPNARVLRLKYGRLVDSKKNRSGGDPWVIALARTRGLTVVTAEKAADNLTKPKIPDVCGALGIACIEVVDFFRQQKWRL
jgi:hypothetical protein